MKRVLLVMLVAVLSCSDGGDKFAGPFEIMLREPVKCDDEGTREIHMYGSMIRKKGRNLYTYTTNVSISTAFSDEIQVTAGFSVWGNGGWRPNYLTIHLKNGCSSMQNILPDVTKQVLEIYNRTSCPIPPGDFRIVDVNANPKASMPQLPYNKYKVLFVFSSLNGTRLGCTGAIMDIVPKENKRG